MSDQIKHECGIAMIRLLQPLDYYKQKYGSALYGLNKLQLLLQKQRNRGQDGAGMATVKLDAVPGSNYIDRHRSVNASYLEDLFGHVFKQFEGLSPEQLGDGKWMKANRPFCGELLLGHLRYGTHGDNSIQTCHPFWRSNNWMNRNLVVAGNFNLTNVDELFEELVGYGQYPVVKSDTVTVMEKIGHFLDDEIQRLHTWFKVDGYNNVEINDLIIQNLDIARLLRRACKRFDGGFVMCGMIGHGDAFVLRDPGGIRPAYYYQNEEIVVVASERPAIQTAFNAHYSKVKEIKPGHALVIKKDGSVKEELILESKSITPCSFERIYFSRGTDRDIYNERKKLGENLAEPVMKAIKNDLENTVFTFVPNTAEVAFYGLVKGVEARINELKREKILELGADIKPKKLEKILNLRPRVEKLIVKDAKLRTFIADDVSRHDLVGHVYDVTYGIVQNEVDTIVLLDDSIVRGTTLRDSIISIVARLRPKKIIVVSSAPQIRYPDCYGIDMSRLKDFVAFQALVALLKEKDLEHLLDETLEKCKAQEDLPKEYVQNQLQELYDTFSYEAISQKIAEIVTPKGVKCKVEVIYQTLKGLHNACPTHNGDWYFSGDYPTPGGNKVVNRSFINFMEKSNARAY